MATDESRFCSYGDDRRPRVWRRRGERFHQNNVRPVIAFNGGSAGISRFRRTRLPIVRGYVDQILQPIVLSMQQNSRGFILKHDNARPHTANDTRQFLERHDIVKTKEKEEKKKIQK